jgi:hypothetical protein
MESFYAIAISNSSTDLYPENSLIKFKNNLPHEIDVTGFQIALQSISFDNDFGNVPTNVLGVKRHFLLFETKNDLTPIAVYNIRDFHLPLTSLIEKTNADLNKRTRRITFADGGGKVKIVVIKSVLLIHINVFNWLFDGADSTISFREQDYVVLDAEKETKVFLSKKEYCEKPFFPKMIKVQMEEMQQNISEVKSVQDLATIIINDNHQPFYNVCKRKEYFKMNTNRLTSLSFCLVDENNYPLLVNPGQSTFLKLQLKRFRMKSFVLRLSSLESSDIFADNVSSSFRILLQQSIDEVNYEVALSSIFLPTEINLRNMLTEDFYIDISIDANGTYTRVLLNHLPDLSKEGFTKYCNTKINRSFPRGAPILIEERANKLAYRPLADNVWIAPSELMMYLLNRQKYRGGKKSFDTRKNVVETLGDFDFKKLSPKTILMYCNFTTPIVVGNTFGQVLQIIPFSETTENSLMKYEAQHLDFISLSMNDKTVLQFEMRDTTGKLIPFNDNKTEILLTLVFREKN